MSQPSSPIANIFRWDGTVGRQSYAIVGILAFALKNNLDRFVAHYFLPGSPDYFFYWAPLGKAARLDHLSRPEINFLGALIVLSVPFIWVGLAMTIRRLRDVAQPVWLASMFFVPFVNLVFFLILCLIPSSDSPMVNEAAPWPHVRPLDQLIPQGRLASAVLSVAVTTAIGLLFLLLGTQLIGSYGWSLFVAMPFCMGLFSALMYSYREPRTLSSCIEVSVLPIVVIGVIVLAIAVEGFICIMMAAPLGLVFALLGGALGYQIQAHYWSPRNKPAIISMIVLIIPSMFLGENAASLQPPGYTVRSAIIINAPPERVWNQVVAFAEIAPPQELLFRAGVGYPIRAEISGSGVGATRHCVFSTGAFEEPITVWDEPNLLKFTVTKNPEPLNELSPWGHIHPPHMHGYFVSYGGQFLLTELSGHRTRVEGTTWYRHTMWPATYWHWWSDYIIHRIHMRVLNHIRDRAEAGTVQALAASAVSSTR